ncbi:hypothetical protein D9619_000174 [Psilocybe cf. subviscida]|uniref:Uncharacterized protein n=1 Tax=Psilocybe cf. subviscida TaxID=2480587 RepID=A0A8H5BCL3_9AGAR|nr:hypothetical protein D9619_000174 [Psilocybe cf. subviscida]
MTYGRKCSQSYSRMAKLAGSIVTSTIPPSTGTDTRGASITTAAATMTQTANCLRAQFYVRKKLKLGPSKNYPQNMNQELVKNRRNNA